MAPRRRARRPDRRQIDPDRRAAASPARRCARSVRSRHAVRFHRAACRVADRRARRPPGTRPRRHCPRGGRRRARCRARAPRGARPVLATPAGLRCGIAQPVRRPETNGPRARYGERRGRSRAARCGANGSREAQLDRTQSPSPHRMSAVPGIAGLSCARVGLESPTHRRGAPRHRGKEADMSSKPGSV